MAAVKKIAPVGKILRSLRKRLKNKGIKMEKDVSTAVFLGYLRFLHVLMKTAEVKSLEQRAHAITPLHIEQAFEELS